MSANYYDVVVLGSSLGPLVAGTLLAKRGFRVLVIGQDEVSPTYSIAGYTLPRAPFTFTATSSPITRRIFSELALHQLLRRRLSSEPVSFQFATPSIRFDVTTAPRFESEVEREFPEVKRSIDDFHRDASSALTELDEVLDRDLVWPPSTFFERREFDRVASRRALRSMVGDPFASFPEGHPFRQVVESVARFDDGVEFYEPSALRVLRLYGSRWKNSTVVQGGMLGLEDLLVTKLRTHSGELRREERVEQILVRHGSVTGVRIAGSDEEIGCGAVIAGIDLARLLRLLPDRRPFEEIFEANGEPQAKLYRYTLNVVMAETGVPEGMGREIFFVRDPKRPLEGENLLRVQSEPSSEPGMRLLTVETLLPRRAIEEAGAHIGGLRERVFASLAELIPFLGKHAVLIDSPHDGRPALDVRTGETIPHPEPWTRGTHAMSVIHRYPVLTHLGVAALSARTPIRRLFLASGQVLPGLGTEGALAAAWSAARIVTRADKHKAWMRGRLWTKVEI